MNIREIVENGVKIAVVETAAQEIVLRDTASALDLAVSLQYERQIDRIVIGKEAVTEEFFILSTGVAGEILQKFTNYGIKMAIFGDFSHYTSKPLQDFIRESNRGDLFFFVPTQQEALQKLANAKGGPVK